MKHFIPEVIVSYAQSADGRIATTRGVSQWISGEESLTFAHQLRRNADAVLVGIGTVLKDNPKLTCRLPGVEYNPVRIVLDSQLRIPLESQLVQTADTVRTIVFASDDNKKVEKLKEYGVEVYFTEKSSEGCLSLVAVLETLFQMNIKRLFVEGGAGVLTSFFKYRLVNRLYLVNAPLIIGCGTEAIGNLGTTDLNSAYRGKTVSVEKYGNDVIWHIEFPGRHKQAAALQTGSTEKNQLPAKAVYFTAPQSIEIKTEQIERSPGEVLVYSRVMGISAGTELHIYENTFPGGSSEDGLDTLSGKMEYPLKYGYMNAGITEKGDRVFAFYPHQDAFFCPEQSLISFPQDTEFEDMVMYPSVETAFTIVMDARPLPGENILILGQGVIGLLTAEILSNMYGHTVAAIEQDTIRVQKSRSFGIACFTPEDKNEKIIKAFNGLAPDKVINVSGSGAALQAGIDIAGFEAMIIEASWYGTKEVSLQLGKAFHRKRLRVKASQVSSIPGPELVRWDKPRRTNHVISLISRIKPSKYITHRYPLDKAEEAFSEISGRKNGIIQAVLLPEKA